MSLPNKLVQHIQNEYVSSKYKDGIFVFTSIEEETLELIIKSFLEWAEKNKILVEDKLDINELKKW